MFVKSIIAFCHTKGMKELPTYCVILMRELDLRKQRNPRYSQRAFARDLHINQALLSRILANKIILSRNQALTILEQLVLSEDEKKNFIESLLWQWWNLKKI